ASGSDRHARLHARRFEMIVSLLELTPEADIAIVAAPGHVFRRHAERERLKLERSLTASEGVAGERINLLDLRVGHCVAAGGRALAVHHEVRAGAAVGAIVSVGVTDVERQMKLRVRVHLPWADRIKSFRRLPVAFAP